MISKPPLETKYFLQRQTSLLLETSLVSRIAENGPSSGWWTGWLSSIAICICVCLQVAFFHYDSITEECQLYRTMEADCQAMGAPKTAPSFEECTTTTTTATTTTTSKR